MAGLMPTRSRVRLAAGVTLRCGKEFEAMTPVSGLQMLKNSSFV